MFMRQKSVEYKKIVSGDVWKFNLGVFPDTN